MKRPTITILYLISHISYLAFAAQPLEYLPFTFCGRIVDYAHIAYDGDSVVEIRVKKQDGTLLAKGSTVTGGSLKYNYAVNVSLTSTGISGSVTNGTPVIFEFVDPQGIVYTGLVPTTQACVGAPGGYQRVDVILATDANHDGVADEYVETLEYMMWKRGIETYDPSADYDGDGVSNYAEYVAGTSPFDATDKFSVREMALEAGQDGYIAFKFQVSQGRYYTVDSATELGTPVWKEAPFAVADPSAALQSSITVGPSETGYRVIYLKKGTDASRFWKLKVE